MGLPRAFCSALAINAPMYPPEADRFCGVNIRSHESLVPGTISDKMETTATKTTAPPATVRTLSGESSPKKSVAANSKMTIGST